MIVFVTILVDLLGRTIHRSCHCRYLSSVYFAGRLRQGSWVFQELIQLLITTNPVNPILVEALMITLFATNLCNLCNLPKGEASTFEEMYI